MHAAEHRGLRELYVMSRQLRDHWRALAGRLEEAAPAEAELLRAGSDEARALIGELTDVTAARGLHGRPAAQGLGARLASLHHLLLDTSLEVNQALRFAVLDVVHVVTLLDYLAALARDDGDEVLAIFLSGWAPRMRVHEDAVRAGAITLGDRPDTAVGAAAGGVAGRLLHGAATVAGTLGEWVDGRAARS
ncbi:MAG TPA: hypothetical protein VMY78_04580 [Solirubrobacteraceae bacterium]|nr:hypothetical protein [Solirubrobacteraceae bacterium]